MEKDKEELLEDEEATEEVEKVENESKANSTPGFKDIVITECKRTINQYKELMANSDDWKLLEGFNNPNKNDDECVNHIMNNLTKKRIYGGADSLMYEYIHEYYVDDLKEEQLKDNWSSCLRPTGAPSTPGPKAQAKEDAKNKITEEQKQKFYEEALEEAKREAKFKAEEDFKKAEAKRKEKEKEQERIRKQKELEKKKAEEEKKAKALEEAKQSGAAEQMSIFDF